MNIIFIHKGDSWYLSYTLNQAKKTNPNANIVLLGDEFNSRYANIVTHALISDYFNTANSFSKRYKHLSTTNHNHELFCIQRWFVWLEYMKAQNMGNAILPDTDVLILQDISKFINELTVNFQYTKGTTNYMGFMYIKTSFLEDICHFITSQYQKQQSLLELEHLYLAHIAENNIGGVSDITLFNRYETEHPNCSLNLEIPPINGCAFINSLESTFYSHNKDGYVDIKWKNKIPYAQLLTGEKIAIMGVHCFGLQKKYIRKLYQGPNKITSRLIYVWKTSLLKVLFDMLRGRKTAYLKLRVKFL